MIFHMSSFLRHIILPILEFLKQKKANSFNCSSKFTKKHQNQSEYFFVSFFVCPFFCEILSCILVTSKNKQKPAPVDSFNHLSEFTRKHGNQSE